MNNLDNFKRSAIDAVLLFRTEVKAILDSNYTVYANIPNSGICSNSIWFSIYNVNDKTASELDFLNATSKIKFVCHLPTNEKQTNKAEIEFLSCSYQLKDAGLKYRKITDKTPLDATKKLIKWVEKNKQIIESQGLYTPWNKR